MYKHVYVYVCMENTTVHCIYYVVNKYVNVDEDQAQEYSLYIYIYIYTILQYTIIIYTHRTLPHRICKLARSGLGPRPESLVADED